MTPAALLTHLQSLGCTMRLDGATLHVSPRALLTPDLSAAIRTHKAALVALLAPAVEDSGPWGFHSTVLAETLWVCWDPAEARGLPAGVTAYTPAEIRCLEAMQAQGEEPAVFADVLRAMHGVKQVFEAAILGVAPAQLPSLPPSLITWKS